MPIVEIQYQGENISLQIKAESTFEEILKEYVQKIGIDINSIFFLYSGNRISNYNLNFEQIANKIDKEIK